MKNQRTFTRTLIAAALFALCLPVVAAAQGTYDPWGNNRSGDYRRDRDYGRDRDYRRDGRYDDRNYNNGYYNRSALRDSVRRVKDRSDDFRKHLDRYLDHSRYDGRRSEDRINEVARDFHQAADRLKDRYDDGRNLNRSSEDARELLEIGARLDRFVARNMVDNRLQSEWSGIRSDLRVIADIYGFRNGYFNGGYNNGGYRNGTYNRGGNYDPYDPRNNGRGRFPF